MGKFVRKNRGPMAAVACIIVALSLGLIASLIFFVEARRNYNLAEEGRRATEAALYVANVTAAGLSLDAANVMEARRRLEACPEEYRGWEWKHFNLRSDLSLKILPGHETEVCCVAFGRKYIASGDHGERGTTLRLWDAKTGIPLNTLPHERRVASVAFSPDETRVVTGSWDGRVRLWDIQSGELLDTLPGHEDHVYCVAFSSCGFRKV